MHSNSHPESDQHTKPERATREAFAHYTTEQRERIEELQNIQTARKLSDAKFGRPADVSESAWNRAKHGKYGGPFDGDLGAIIARLSRHYLPQTRGFVEVEHMKTMLAGIDFAREQAAVGDEKRGFWLIGETGDGKTALARVLEREREAVRIHATPAWSSGYYAILKAVARKLGVEIKRNVADLEREIFAKLNDSATAKVLVFEEVQQQSASTIKMLLFFWLALLNETKAVLVVLTVSEFFKDFKDRGGEYARQFLRRTLVIQCDRVNAERVLDLMPAEWPRTDELRSGAKVIASAARERGGFDLVKESIALLKAEHSRAPSSDECAVIVSTYFERHQLDRAA